MSLCKVVVTFSIYSFLLSHETDFALVRKSLITTSPILLANHNSIHIFNCTDDCKTGSLASRVAVTKTRILFGIFEIRFPENPRGHRVAQRGDER